MAKKMTKSQITKAHKIARAIKKKGGGAREPYAVGTAVVQKQSRKRKRR